MATARVVADSAQYVKSTDGSRIVRTLVLEGVAGAGTDAYLTNAGDDAAVPAIGDAHSVKTGLKAQSVVTTDLGGGFCQVVIEYAANSGSTSTTLEYPEPPADNAEGAVWNLSFALESKTVTRDSAAADLVVTRPAALQPADGEATLLLEMEVRRPVAVLRAERRELDPPMSRMRSAIGKVNSTTHGPYAAGTLLCSGIQAQSDNTSPDPTPSTYDGWHKVSYEFTYDPDGWDREGTWTRFDGTQPAAHDAGSRVLFDLYAAVNFETLLDLNFTDPS